MRIVIWPTSWRQPFVPTRKIPSLSSSTATTIKDDNCTSIALNQRSSILFWPSLLLLISAWSIWSPPTGQRWWVFSYDRSRSPICLSRHQHPNMESTNGNWIKEHELSTLNVHASIHFLLLSSVRLVCFPHSLLLFCYLCNVIFFSSFSQPVIVICLRINCTRRPTERWNDHDS